MKKYFSHNSQDECFGIDYYIDEMKEFDIEEMIVIEAVIDRSKDYFFCTEYMECGTIGECGKYCKGYSPRNGKSGCCKHRGYCYEHGDEFILNVNGKLKPVVK